VAALAKVDPSMCNFITYSEGFLDQLECPIQFSPLKDAVILIPCGHPISELAIEQL